MSLSALIPSPPSPRLDVLLPTCSFLAITAPSFCPPDPSPTLLGCPHPINRSVLSTPRVSARGLHRPRRLRRPQFHTPPPRPSCTAPSIRNFWNPALGNLHDLVIPAPPGDGASATFPSPRSETSLHSSGPGYLLFLFHILFSASSSPSFSFLTYTT